MKPLFTLFVLACIAVLPGCTIGCKIQNAAAGAISSGLSNALQCANSAQVLSDVTALLAKTNICSVPAKKPGEKTGPIAIMICPILSGLAVSQLGKAIPDSWQCNPALAKDGLAAALTAACNVIPF